MSTDQPEKDDCLSFFISELGLRARAIPEKPGVNKTPDIFVEDDPVSYLVEIKTRKNSEDWEQSLAATGKAESVTTWNSTGWVFTIAGKAMNQFRAYDREHNHLWILWIYNRRDYNTEATSEQIMNAVFGVRDFYTDFGNGACTEFCLAAQQSVFNKYGELDFAGVLCDGTATLFLNEHSERTGTCLSSTLYGKMDEKFNVNSISLLRETGLWFYDGEAQASDEEKADYLAQKYGVERVIASDMKTHSATARVRGGKL